MNRLITLLILLLGSTIVYSQQEIVMQLEISEPIRVVGLTNQLRCDSLEDGSIVIVAPKQIRDRVKHIFFIELLDSKLMMIFEIIQDNQYDIKVNQTHIAMPTKSGIFKYHTDTDKMEFTESAQPIDDFFDSRRIKL